MKLDFDCVRDILFYLEKEIYIDENFTLHCSDINSLCEKNRNYEKGKILYTVLKLYEGGYIRLFGEFEPKPNLANNYPVDGMIITEITFKGHQYIDSIRDNNIWNQVKSKAASLSFSIISQIAVKLITSQF